MTAQRAAAESSAGSYWVAVPMNEHFIGPRDPAHQWKGRTIVNSPAIPKNGAWLLDLARIHKIMEGCLISTPKRGSWQAVSESVVE